MSLFASLTSRFTRQPTATKWTSALAAVALAAAGTTFVASAQDDSAPVVCKTRVGYLRISATGECRRSETQVELPQGPAGPEGPAGADGAATDESIIASLQSQIDALNSKVHSLKPVSCAAFAGALKYRTLLDVDLSGCNLKWTDVSDVVLNGSDLSRADLSYGGTCQEWRGSFRSTDLRETNFSHANENCGSFGGVDFSASKATGADFSFSGLYSDNFDESTLDAANLSNGYRESNSFQRASLIGADLSASMWHANNFANANLTGANLTEACINAGTFARANLTGANFARANLSCWGEPTTLAGSTLAGASFTDARINVQSFKDVNLDGLDLSHAILTGSSIDGVIGTPVALPRLWTLVDGTLTLDASQAAVNGHWYRYVDDVVDWETARTRASALTWQGLKGHLATISSQSENEVIRSLVAASGGSPAWIAASQVDPPAGYTYAYAWRAGPEDGQVFYRCTTARHGPNGVPDDCESVDGAFTAWHPQQPDGDEPVVQVNYGNAWNNCTSEAWACGNRGYVVEFEPDWTN